MSNRRSQKAKPAAMRVGNEAYIKAMLGKRGSSAASKHRMATDYRRKPKHPGKGWQ